MLSVRWFDQWHPALDEAMSGLADLPNCPRTLFRELMQNQDGPRKRIALVLERDAAAGIVGIRKRQRHWEVVGVVPRTVNDSLDKLITALHIELETWTAAEPHRRLVRWSYAMPIRKVNLQSNFEYHWRGSRSLKEALRKGRQRCADMSFEIDTPGAAEWVLTSWAEKWKGDAAGLSNALPDRLIEARYFESQGLLHSFVLKDGDRPIAGLTAFAFDWLALPNSVGQSIGAVLTVHRVFCSNEYRWHSAGNRLFDLVFNWAKDNGYEKASLGCNLPYMERWAPIDGHFWIFLVAPWHVYAFKGAARKLTTSSGRYARSIPHPSRGGQPVAAAATDPPKEASTAMFG